MAKLYTEAGLKKKTIADLKELMAEHGWEDFEDLKKAELIENLLTEEAPSEDEVDDEVDDAPADEVDDEEEDDEELELPAPDDEVDDIEEEAKPEAKPKRTRAAKATTDKPTKATADGESTLAAKQVALILKTEAKTLRQFFRSEASTVEKVGSGGRYEFAESDLPKIKEEFASWKSAHGSRGTKRGPKGEGEKTAGEAIEEIESIDEIEELEDEAADTKPADTSDEVDDTEIDDDDLELDE